MTYFISENDELLIALEAKRVFWQCELDPIFVNSVIEIAKSSFVFWNNNIDCLLDDSFSRADKDICKRRVALADVWGAGWGALTGGLVGAMFGAIGGTLGAATGVAVTGGC